MLSDQVAIVTGAGSGIGRACALELAREGAAVVLAEVSPDTAADTESQIRDAGGRALAVVTDVTDSDSVRDCVRSTLDRFRRIDILVNNAGAYPRTPWTELSEQRWRELIELNLNGAFRMCLEVTPAMMEQRSGKIINISSITVDMGAGELAPYMAAKAGIIGFTRALARDLGSHNVNVNCIAPGAVRTEGEEKVSTQEQIDAFVATQCLQRRVEPWDIARAVVFFAGEGSRNITGQTLVVDAGKVFR